MKARIIVIVLALIGIGLITGSFIALNKADILSTTETVFATGRFDEQQYHYWSGVCAYLSLGGLICLTPAAIVILLATGGTGSSHRGEVQIEGKDDYGRPVKVWIKVEK
jgi:hypothetical protein